MVLTGGLVLLLPGTSAQVVSGLLVSQFYILILTTYKPYKEPTDDSLQFFASLQILLTLLAGLLLKMDDPDNRYYEHIFMTYVLISINVMVLVIGIGTMLFQDAIFLGFRKVIKLFLQRMNEKCCKCKKKSETKVEPSKSTLAEKNNEKEKVLEVVVAESSTSHHKHHVHSHIRHKHHEHRHTHHEHHEHVHNTHHHSHVEMHETNNEKLQKTDNEHGETADQDKNVYNDIVNDVEISEENYAKLQRVKLEVSQAQHRKSTELRLAQRKKSKKLEKKKLMKKEDSASINHEKNKVGRNSDSSSSSSSSSSDGNSSSSDSSSSGSSSDDSDDYDGAAIDSEHNKT